MSDVRFVKNIRGTSNSRRSKSWLELYRRQFPFDNGKCAVVGCGQNATCGAHVIIDGNGRQEYILPMCQAHNLTYDTVLRVNKEPIRVVDQ